MIETAYDVIVAGTGAAGLFTALSLPGHLKILMITKDALENSDSYLAQGGICVMKSPDDYDSYFEDTMRAGRYENNKESVRIMIENSPEIINDLVRYGVEFEHKGNEFAYTREGAHSAYRILYHKDETGREITSRLIDRVKERPNVTLASYTTMVDLLVSGNTCTGIVIEDESGTFKPVKSKSVFLATGGLGGLFTNSTNFRHITGDSFALALKYNIELENINYIQIHPTTLYSQKEGRRFLISESVRGEGAVLLNPDGERFTDELQPRDVVTEAIRKEMEKYNTPYVYLSLTDMPKEDIIYRFPNIYQHCLEEGYDLSKDWIPITPAQHYLMGGIKTDTYARTSMEHLFAVGEAGCNGVHGANRLASNSLLESLVFAKRGAKLLASGIDSISLDNIPAPAIRLKYPDAGTRQKHVRTIIMNELKRRDGEFYAKWCNDEN